MTLRPQALGQTLLSRLGRRPRRMLGSCLRTRVPADTVLRPTAMAKTVIEQRSRAQRATRASKTIRCRRPVQRRRLPNPPRSFRHPRQPRALSTGLLTTCTTPTCPARLYRHFQLNSLAALPILRTPRSLWVSQVDFFFGFQSLFAVSFLHLLRNCFASYLVVLALRCNSATTVPF